MILTEGGESKEGLQNPSYLSRDGTGDEKGNPPLVLIKLQPARGTVLSAPESRGSFYSGVVSTIVLCQKMLPRKREFPSTGGGRVV